MKIRDYKAAVQNMKLPDFAKERTLDKMLKSKKFYEKEKIIMSRKKILAICLSAVLVLGAAAFAASGTIVSWYSSSSSKPDYTSLPTAQKCEKDAGFIPVLIDKFENGYVFKEGSIVRNSLVDENEKSAEKFKSLDFRYEKDDNIIYFSQAKYFSETDSKAEKADEKDGIEIYYYSYVNKFVPADYKLTEDEKAAEQNGEIVFSYGTDNIEIKTICTVSWEKDNIHSQIMQMDSNLTKEELINMAKEAIN